jgi:hypothetical protein
MIHGIVAAFFLISCTIFLPLEVNGGTIYKCINKNGVVILTDRVTDNLYKCIPLESYENLTPAERSNMEKEKASRASKISQELSVSENTGKTGETTRKDTDTLGRADSQGNATVRSPATIGKPIP